MAFGIKKEDTVAVINGREKGKKGRVLAVNRQTQRIMIEKVNIIKKHMKPSKKYSQGGIIEKEASIHASNVMLVCPKCSDMTKVGVLALEGDKKHRICKKCKEVID
jgi:large subunit ribosomal protein L24